ncbi:MAG: hypothetical protein Q8Q39_01665, partial [bacterium]|nr:hypothetical protein [bacterium]
WSYSLFAAFTGILLLLWCLRGRKLSLLEIVSVGSGLGILGVTALVAGLMLFMPFTTAMRGAVGAAGLCSLFILWEFFKGGDLFRFRQWLVDVPRGMWQKKHIGAFVAAVALAALAGWYADIYFNTFMLQPDGKYAAAVAGYGDVPYHLAQISQFTQNDRLILDDTTYAGAPLKYHFFINFASAVLAKLGAPLQFAFHIPGFLFSVTGIALLYALLKRLSGHRGIAYGGTLLALFSSNTRYLLLLRDEFFESAHSLKEYAAHLGNLPFKVATVWDAVWPNQNVDITAIATHFLTHQRASLMGVWALCAAILLWLLVAEGEEKPTMRTVAPMAMLLALFPILHMHGLAALGLAGATWCAYVCIAKQENGMHMLKNLIWTLPIVFFLAASQLSAHPDITYSPQIRLGWMTNPSEIGGIRLDPAGAESARVAWLRLLWQNFGVLGPVTILALGVLVARRRAIDANIFWFFIPAPIIIFTFSNIVKLQAWDVDTNKLLAYTIIFSVFSLAILAGHLRQIITPKALITAGFWVIVGLAIPIGLLDVWARTSIIHPWIPVIFDTDAVATADWVRNQTPKDAVFISSDNHLNPVNSLGGRRVVLGYKGWLWTHGVDYGARDQLLRAFIEDPRAHRDAFSGLGPVYALLDAKWRHEYPELDRRLRDVFGDPVFAAGQFTVWKIH